jgi:hypothetical protein
MEGTELKTESYAWALFNANIYIPHTTRADRESVIRDFAGLMKDTGKPSVRRIIVTWKEKK